MMPNSYVGRFEDVLASGLRIMMPKGDLYEVAVKPLALLGIELYGDKSEQPLTGNELEGMQPTLGRFTSRNGRQYLIFFGSPHDFASEMKYGGVDIAFAGYDIIVQQRAKDKGIRKADASENMFLNGRFSAPKTESDLKAYMQEIISNTVLSGVALYPLLNLEAKPSAQLLVTYRDPDKTIRDLEGQSVSSATETKYKDMFEAFMGTHNITPKPLHAVDRNVEGVLYWPPEYRPEAINVVSQTGSALRRLRESLQEARMFMKEDGYSLPDDGREFRVAATITHSRPFLLTTGRVMDNQPKKNGAEILAELYPEGIEMWKLREPRKFEAGYRRLLTPEYF